MLNLKTTVSVPTEVSIELETPAFYKKVLTTNMVEHLAVIDECTITMWVMEGQMTQIQNTATEKMQKKILEAYQTWEHISEEEFMEALDKALKDFNFKPSLRHITAKEGSKVTI
jgi:RPA family protein